MRVTKIIYCVVLIFFAATLGGCKGFGKAVVRGTTRLAVNAVADNMRKDDSSNRSSKPNLRAGAIVAGGAIVANEIVSEDPHWLKDLICNAYVWNFCSQEFDGVRLNGDILREGDKFYAHGHGKLFWLKDGQVVEITEGTFEHGKPHGKFKHTRPNGEKFLTNWNHGEEIPLEISVHDDGFTAKDLSLGDLTIDDPAEKVQAVLGSPYNVKTDGEGYTRLTYRDVEVVVYNGKIQALVSLSGVLATPRGIREGSSVREVVEKYGTNYVESISGHHDLYEYEITSADGHPCYLRFAADNFDRKIEYISERFVQ